MFTTLGVRHDQETTTHRASDRKMAILDRRMIGIRNGDRQRIVEHRAGFGERDAVLADVGRSLPWVPFELHSLRLVGSRKVVQGESRQSCAGSPLYYPYAS